MGPWSSTPDMGTVLHTWSNGRFVQIQDGFRSNKMLGPMKGAHFPWSSLCNGLYIWHPVYRLSKCQAKQTQSSLFWQLNAIHLHKHQKRVSLAIEVSSFVLMALNATSHLLPHSTILHRCNSNSPANSTFSKKYQDWNREWCHLNKSLFLIER